MKDDLFKAILAMDSYYRGYDAGINIDEFDANGNVISTKIGTASIVTRNNDDNDTVYLDSSFALNDVDQGVGFYALTYDLGGGDYVIAYRGTDYPQNDDTVPKDIHHGWTLGEGLTASEQGRMAIDFYNQVVDELYGTAIQANNANINISLTGHSLGGGLSGFVGALYDQDAVVFDSMTYELAVTKAYEDSRNYYVRYILAGFEQVAEVTPENLQSFINTPGRTILEYGIIDPILRDKIYDNSTPWASDLEGITGYHVKDEILDLVLLARSLPGSSAESEAPFYLGEDGVFYDLVNTPIYYQAIYTAITTYVAGTVGATFSLAGYSADKLLEGVALHSQASLVIRMFADEPEVNSTNWKNAAKYFWPLLYDNGFADNIGMDDPRLGGELQTASGFDGILRGIIAYSAIDQEFDGNGVETSVTVFGDTGIRALYDDANELGASIVAAGAGSTITTYAEDISKAFVQFAGQLALSKLNRGDVFVENHTEIKATDGVLSYDPAAGDTTLTIDFTDTLWSSAGKGTLPPMVARADLVSHIWADTGVETEIRAAALEMWGNDTTNVVERVVFAVSGGTYYLPENQSANNKTTLFVGSAGDDEINAAKGNHFIMGLGGDDTLDYGGYDSSVTATFEGNNRAKIIDGNSTNTLKDYAIDVERYVLTELGDTVKFSSAEQLYNVSVGSGFINVGAGRNHLDFSGFEEGVDIQTAYGLAYAASSPNFQSGFNIQGFTNFTGSSYNDNFVDGTEEQAYVGGAGLDTLNYSVSIAPIIVNTFSGFFIGIETLILGAAGWVFDQAQGFERFIGTGGDDYFYAKAEGIVDASYSGGGNSSFLNENDTVFQGRDIVDFSGYAANNAEEGVTVTLTGSGSGFGTDGLGGTFILSGIEQIIGTDGVDTLIGDGGSNWLFGGKGADTLEGNGGDDHLIGGEDANTLSGGSGNDTYYFYQEQGNTFSANITDSSGANDKIYMMQEYEMGRLDTFVPYAGVEYIENSDGSLFEMAGLGLQFTQNLVAAGITGDSFYGDLNDNTLNGGQDNDYISGHDGADTITGNAGSDYIDGDAGDDTIDGGVDDDRIFGSIGNDILLGDDGNDKLVGEEGSDNLSGGEGDDALYANADGNYLTDQDFDGLNGENGNDKLYGSGGGDILFGGEGNDYLYGKASDSLFGDEGQDMLLSIGDNALLDGGEGNDYLEGNGVNTTFIANAGTDVVRATGANSILLLDGESLESLKFGLASNGSYIITKTNGDSIILPNGIDYISFSEGDQGTAFSTILEQKNFTYRSSLVQDTSAQDVGVTYSYLPQKYNGFDEDNIYYAYADGDEVFSGGGANFFIFDTAYDPGNKTSIYGTIDAEQDIIRLDGVQSLDDVQLVFDFGIGSLHFGHSEIVILNALENGASGHYLVALDSTAPDAEPGEVTLYTLSQLHHVIKNSNDGDMNGYSANDEIYAIGLGGAVNGLTGNDLIHGSLYSDVIHGGTGNDTINGNEGSDEIYGDEGDDSIFGGEGADEIDGGEGIDNLNGGYGSDILNGGNGNDILDGNSGDDEIDGGAGEDNLTDSEGNDIYHARSGDTLVVGAGDNIIISEEMDLSGFSIDLSDFVSANNDYEFTRDFSINSQSDYKLVYENNSLTIDSYSDIVNSPTIHLGNGIDVLLSDLVITGYGNEQDNSYSESNFDVSQNDLVYARGGNDNFTFMNGDDVFYGGDGNDTASKVFGFSFTINGVEYGTPSGTGNLTAYGEGGDDILQGGIGDDSLDGGIGNDAIYDLWGGTDTLTGGAGDDVFLLDADGDDTVDGGDGSDTVVLSAANTLSTIDGSAAVSFEVDLTQGTVTSSNGAVHDLISIENALGSELDDIILGSTADNRIGGYAGDDYLQGGLGNDSYLFEVVTDSSGNPDYSGDDLIYDLGGAFDNLVLSHIQSASELEITQDGLDMLISFEDGTARIVNQFSASSYHIENLILAENTSYDLVNYTSWYVAPLPVIPTTPPVAQNTFTGTGSINFFIGSNSVFDAVNYSFSTDPVSINLQTNVVSGGFAANDFLSSIEMVTGSNLSAFGDALYGSIVANVLHGLAGNDILSGGAGDDFLYGGSGNDTYLFNLGDGIDVISETSGFDILSLGVGISAEDITYTRIGNDLYIRIGSGFLIQNFYSGDPDALVEQISFADGSTFDLTTLLTPINTPPVAQNDSAATNEDTAVTISVLGNDSDADNDPLEVSILDNPASGSVVVNANNTITYTPNADYNGADSFTYQINDGQGGAASATVSLTINSVNDVPVAADDAFNGTEDIIVTGNLLTNHGSGADSDSDGGTLSVTAGIFTTANGSVTIASNGDFTYTPTAHHNGSDSFSYTLSDGQGGTDTGLVTLSLAAVNDAPLAVDDSFSGDMNTAITGNLLGNNGNGVDSDIEDDSLSVNAQSLSTSHGEVTILANGSFTYTPTTGYFGNDSFNYTVNDGNGGSDTGAVSITVNDTTIYGTSGNDTITGSGSGDTIHGLGGNDTLYGELGNDILFGDAGNDTLKGRDGNDSLYGGDGTDYLEGGNENDLLNGGTGTDTLKGSAGIDTYQFLSSLEGTDTIVDFRPLLGEKIDLAGVLQYAPGFTPSQVFSDGYLRLAQAGADVNLYLDMDGSAGNGAEILFITLQAIQASDITASSFILPSGGSSNSAPVAVNDSTSTNEDTAVTISVLANDSDPDSDPLSVSILTSALHGTLVVNTDNTVTYTPTANYNGSDSFTYQVSDGHGGTAGASVSLTVNSVNDAPLAKDDAFNSVQDTVLTGNVISNNGNGIDSDIDGDTLSVTAQTFSTSHGSVTIAGNGDFTYTPTNGYVGADGFTYQVNDGHGGSDTGLVSLTISASNEILGTSGNDTIYGTANDDLIRGLAGNDYLSGEAGHDTIYGDAGADTLKGRDGNDLLYGGDGADYLEGNNGNDILYGGLGVDTLKGSSGVDTFVFQSIGDAGDTIQDYSYSSGEKIDISDLLAGYNAPTDDISDFVQITDNGTNSFLAVDVDGGANNFVQIATLSAIIGLTNEEALETSGHLITV